MKGIIGLLTARSKYQPAKSYVNTELLGDGEPMAGYFSPKMCPPAAGYFTKSSLMKAPFDSAYWIKKNYRNFR